MKKNDPIHDASLRSLIECVVNDEASPAQTDELEQRLLQDERAREAYLDYVNLHSSLRRWFLAAGVAQASPLVMDAEQVSGDAYPTINRWFAGFVIIACVLVAVLVYQSGWLRPGDDPMANLPVIVRLAGEPRIKTAAGSVTVAAIGRTVAVGETLHAEGDSDEVVLRYPDDTEMKISGEAVLAVGRSPQGGKQLHLLSGMLRADVAAQPAQRPLLIVTPHATVRVLGTRFELATSEDDGTRLDLESGRVELVRGREKPVTVEPKSIAIVPSTPDPIRIAPRPTIVDLPQREAAFPGVKSVEFSASGTALVAVTRWQAVYWYDDDRLEAVPFGARGDTKVYLKGQSDSLLVFEEKNPRKLVLWNPDARQPLKEFGDFDGLQRSFCEGNQRPDGWTAPVNIAAMPPQGEWLAFQVGREFRIWQAGEDRWSQFPRRYDGKPVTAMAASPDGRLLALAIRRTRIDVVDSHSGEVTATWPILHRVPFSLAFTADGNRLVVGLDGRVKVHDSASGEVLATFEQPGAAFGNVAASPDGRLVAASSQSHRVQVWDLKTHRELTLIDVKEWVHDLTFSPDSNQLAVVSKGGRMTLWDVEAEKSESRISKSESSFNAQPKAPVLPDNQRSGSEPASAAGR